MTRITFELDQDGLYKGFICEGHAGYPRFFRRFDLVCCAISALTINFVNSVDELTKSDIEVDADDISGYMKVSVKDYSLPEVQLLFKSLVIGLKAIEDDYSKYLKLTNRR